MSSLIAFIESIPALVKLVNEFIGQWQDYQISKIDISYSDKAKQRKAIINSLKKAEDDEERKVLTRMLFDLNNK